MFNWERNLAFITNLDFLIPMSLQPDDVNLRHFKLSLFDISEYMVCNIKGLRRRVEKI